MKKRISSLIVAVSIILRVISAITISVSAETSGTCGENITWLYDEDTQKLALSGSGNMYNYTSEKYVPWYNIRKNIKTVAVGDGITSIGNYAFYECTNMTQVAIPETITHIYYASFENCTNLSEILLPPNLTSVGESAFSYCDSLLSINIPDNINIINKFTFYHCDKLTNINIPDKVTTINKHAFGYCRNLKDIKLPKEITSIGEWAFEGCSSISNITIPDSVIEIGSGAFAGCSAMTEITLSQGIEAIKTSLFSGCEMLSKITIPDSVKTIYSGAFNECKSLKNLLIPDNVTTIEGNAFGWYPYLETITIGKGVTEIVDELFRDAYELTSISLPENLTTIGSHAFFNCSKLKSIDIPESVTEIYSYAFGMTGLETVNISKNVELIDYKVFACCKNLKEIIVDSNNLNYVSIDGGLFDKNKTTLYQYASGKESDSYEIPDGVQIIDKYALGYCDNLVNLMLPSSITTIGESAFYDSNKLENIYFKGTLEQWNAIEGYDGNFNIYINNELTIPKKDFEIENGVITQYLGNDENVMIPSVINNENVVSIGAYAFAFTGDIKSITIPRSITTIEQYAFLNCYGLTDITILNPNCTIYDAINTIFETATMYGYTGSTAQAYAEKYERTFIELSNKIDASVVRNDNTINCDNINVSNPAIGGNVMVALYNDNGSLIEVKKCETVENETANFYFNDKIDITNTHIKIFWWDMKTLTPLSKCKIIDIN